MFRLICIITLILLSIVGRFAVSADERILPNDLIFSVGESGKPAKLVIVNAQTLSISPFYQDAIAWRGDARGLQALKWSPDGQNLAILRREDNNASNSFGVLIRLCILTRDGRLRTCMAEEAANYRNQHNESQADSITWSADSQSIFYVSSLPEKTTIRLIEANVITGQTICVLFEYPQYVPYAPPMLIWHMPDLLIIGPNTEQSPKYPIPFQQRSLTSQADEGRNLYSILPIDDFGRLCPVISPQGNYYAVMDDLSGANTIYIFNRQGQFAHIITSTAAFPFQFIGICPIWKSDEAAVIFTGRQKNNPNAFFFQYSLINRAIDVWYRFPDGIDLGKMRLAGGSPYQLSPDNQYLAATNELRGYIVVYSQTGDPISIGNYDSVDAPIWVPPLP